MRNLENVQVMQLNGLYLTELTIRDGLGALRRPEVQTVAQWKQKVPYPACRGRISYCRILYSSAL